MAAAAHLGAGAQRCPDCPRLGPPRAHRTLPRRAGRRGDARRLRARHQRRPARPQSHRGPPCRGGRSPAGRGLRRLLAATPGAPRLRTRRAPHPVHHRTRPAGEARARHGRQRSHRRRDLCGAGPGRPSRFRSRASPHRGGERDRATHRRKRRLGGSDRIRRRGPRRGGPRDRAHASGRAGCDTRQQCGNARRCAVRRDDGCAMAIRARRHARGILQRHPAARDADGARTMGPHRQYRVGGGASPAIAARRTTPPRRRASSPRARACRTKSRAKA